MSIVTSLAMALSQAWGYRPAQIAQHVPGLHPVSWNEARGQSGGIGVGVRWDQEMRYGWVRYSQVFTQYWATLDPSLRMGISVTKRGMGSPLPSPVLAPEISVGDATFEHAFRVHGFDPDLARRVLLAPRVSAALLEAARMARLFGMHDHAVMMTRDCWPQQPEHIGICLDLVHSAASALLSARRRARAPWEQALDDTWEAVAASEGLSYEPQSTRLTGMLGGIAPARLEPFFGRDGIGTYAEVRFASPLPFGLRVYRKTSSDTLDLLFGGQDLTVGHGAFDDAFVVKAKDPAGGVALLRSGGADAIMKLGLLASDVSVNDAGLRVSVPALLRDARSLAHLIDAMRGVARAFSPGGPTHRGAFR